MDDSWIYIEAKRAGRAYVANVRHPLEELREPEYEHHVVLTLDYGAHWRTGLPKPQELTRLQDLEDRLSSHLEGHGMLAGSETCDAQRAVHLYVRGGGPILESFSRREREGKRNGTTVRVTHDPDWQEIKHLAQVSARRALT